MNPLTNQMLTLRDAIGGMPTPLPALQGKRANPETALAILNHEYFVGSYSSRYMARNRRRSWDESAFTVLASGRHAAQHPSVKMERVESDSYHFVGPDRRLSVRECARIQGFPDNYRFVYLWVDDGYKMTGNAVPVPMACAFASAIKTTLRGSSATEKLALPSALPFRDAVGDLPEQACQPGGTCSYATEPQNAFQRQMRGNSTVVTEHEAPHHGAKISEMMSFIPEGKSAQDPDVRDKIPAHLRPGSSFPNSYQRISWEQPAPTITRNSGAPSSANCIHPSEPRALTIREAARCQSFPDTYQFIGTTGQKRELIANAVPPLLATALARAMRHGANQITTNQETNQCTTNSPQAVYSPASGGSTSASSAPASARSGKSNATAVASTSSVATSRTRRVSRMSTRSGRTTCRQSRSSTAGSRVRTSAARDAAKAWLEREVGSGENLAASSPSFARNSSFVKMFRGFYHGVIGATSNPSFNGWGTAGIGGQHRSVAASHGGRRTAPPSR